MKEHDFITIIKKQTQSVFIGDDCAYLKDIEIVVTQDNFVQNVHFKTEWASPYQIGYKAAAVNVSDVLASGAKPKYLSIGLSLPNVDNFFVQEFYRGIKAGSYGAEVIGGDITGSDKVFVSITAIGDAKGRNISSRKNAKSGYIVIVSDECGLSSVGLRDLLDNKRDTKEILYHLEPPLNPSFSELIAKNVKEDYAMMDTSDGLADALFQIAKSSNVKIKTSDIKGMFGAEDYNLVAVIPEKYLNLVSNFKCIGKVFDFDGYYLEIDNKKYSRYEELGLYNHFEV